MAHGGRSRKLKQRFAYGQAKARGRGMTMKPSQAVGPRGVRQPGGSPDLTMGLLKKLGYNIESSKVVLNFQLDWNSVVNVGMIDGTKLGRDNIMGPKTEAALKAASVFANKMPKIWMHYVKKAKIIESKPKPKPTAGGGVKTATKKPSLARRRRRR